MATLAKRTDRFFFGRKISGGVLPTRIKADGWFKVIVVAIIAVAMAVFFLHLFALLLVLGLLVALVIRLAERIMGPEVRIRLTVPPRVSAAIRSWARRRNSGGGP